MNDNFDFDGRRLRWNEPWVVDGVCVGNIISEASFSDVAKFQIRSHPDKQYTTYMEAVDDFRFVHWAWEA